MSAHLCKQIYTSWVQTHPKQYPDLSSSPPSTAYPQRSPSPEKRSMDSDRSDHGDVSPAARPSVSRTSSGGSDKWK